MRRALMLALMVVAASAVAPAVLLVAQTSQGTLVAPSTGDTKLLTVEDVVVTVPSPMVVAWEMLQQQRLSIALQPVYVEALDAIVAERAAVRVALSSDEDRQVPTRESIARALLMEILEPRVRDIKAKRAQDADNELAELCALSAEKRAQIAKIAGKALRRCGGGSAP